jgi:uncharacterized protein YndB with AHSA1/START domain
MSNDIIGAIRMEGDRPAVRLERTYATDTKDLWSALTEPERLGRWFAAVTGDLRQGGEYVVIFDDDDASRTTGTILECRPPEHLKVSWLFSDEGESIVSVDLAPEGAGTRLVLDHTRLPASAIAGYGAGWQVHLERLPAALAGSTTTGPEWEPRWKELMPAWEADRERAISSR